MASLSPPASRRRPWRSDRRRIVPRRSSNRPRRADQSRRIRATRRRRSSLDQGSPERRDWSRCIGVSPHPSGPGTWWRPDGTPLPQPPCDRSRTRIGADGNVNVLAVVVRVHESTRRRRAQMVGAGGQRRLARPSRVRRQTRSRFERGDLSFSRARSRPARSASRSRRVRGRQSRRGESPREPWAR